MLIEDMGLDLSCSLKPSCRCRTEGGGLLAVCEMVE